MAGLTRQFENGPMPTCIRANGAGDPERISKGNRLLELLGHRTFGTGGQTDESVAAYRQGTAGDEDIVCEPVDASDLTAPPNRRNKGRVRK